MGTITGTEIVNLAAIQADDPNNVTWKSENQLEWINDGQRAIQLVRPDANTVTSSVQLVQGTRQTITGDRLLSVVRNMGADGNTPGKAVRFVDRETKDAYEPDWHSAAESIAVDEYIYDERVPTEYYVSPPVPASPDVYVLINESVVPAKLSSLGQAIKISDRYAPALVEWVLFRTFGGDNEATPNFTRASRHLANFYQLLGIKTNSDLRASPKNREHQKG